MEWSAGTKVGILMLRACLVISVLLMIVKAVQIGPAMAAPWTSCTHLATEVQRALPR